jgi:hypothetical protein
MGEGNMFEPAGNPPTIPQWSISLPGRHPISRNTDDDYDDDKLNDSFYERFPLQPIPKMFISQDITVKFGTFVIYKIEII